VDQRKLSRSSQKGELFMVLANEGRWSDYFMSHGPSFDSFWEKFLSTTKRDLVFIIGRGFDPRMCCALESILSKGNSGLRDCIVLNYDDGTPKTETEYADLVKGNWEKLQSLMETAKGSISERNVAAPSKSGRRNTTFNAAYVFESLKEFAKYSDIVIDISAMPRNIYFPLVHKLLALIDAGKKAGDKIPNLHIVVSEDYKLDSCIVDEGLEEKASYLHSFGAIELEATAEKRRVWIPILGERQAIQLDKIRILVDPNEVCPLLPFPSRNTRRADDLIREYRRFLFDEVLIEPRNIIYADERNPFQVYREILKAIEYYNQVLDLVNGCKVIISPISSKLLSVGALLAAYEAKQHGKLVGIAHVECKGYRIEGNFEELKNDERRVLYEIWLAGESYES
jgi:hypothetical protein